MTHRFNIFAIIQGWFFKRQKRKYAKVINVMKEHCDLSTYQSILDIGCGNGALTASLHDIGLKVTALDDNPKRIKIAKRKTKTLPIDYIEADALKKLPFEDKAFDIVITAYLAHAFDQGERALLYKEMGRLAKERVIIQDYTSQRLPWITFSEFFDGGNYYQFTEMPENEMKNCFEDMKRCFKDVKVVKINLYSAWYICTPA